MVLWQRKQIVQSTNKVWLSLEMVFSKPSRVAIAPLGNGAATDTALSPKVDYFRFAVTRLKTTRHAHGAFRNDLQISRRSRFWAAKWGDGVLVGLVCLEPSTTIYFSRRAKYKEPRSVKTSAPTLINSAV
jgi:hypothetical protein